MEIAERIITLLVAAFSIALVAYHVGYVNGYARHGKERRYQMALLLEELIQANKKSRAEEARRKKEDNGAN